MIISMSVGASAAGLRSAAGARDRVICSPEAGATVRAGFRSGAVAAPAPNPTVPPTRGRWPAPQSRPVTKARGSTPRRPVGSASRTTCAAW